MSLWPIKTWIVRRSAPASSRCVAKQWRKAFRVIAYDLYSAKDLLSLSPALIWLSQSSSIRYLRRGNAAVVDRAAP